MATDRGRGDGAEVGACAITAPSIGPNTVIENYGNPGPGSE